MSDPQQAPTEGPYDAAPTPRRYSAAYIPGNPAKVVFLDALTGQRWTGAVEGVYRYEEPPLTVGFTAEGGVVLPTHLRRLSE